MGRVILVTGCSSGIGRALSLALARRGERVFATARDAATLPSELRGLTLDVRNPHSIAAAVETVLAEAGTIDVLVNNAGTHAVGPLVEMPIERLSELFATNVTGMLAVAQAVFPHMAARGKGRIVNIGSIVHMLATPFGGAYAASKAAVHVLTESLRMEVRPFGIDVVEVQPGAVRTGIAEAAARGSERYGDPSSRYRAAYDGIVTRAFASQEAPMAVEPFAERLAEAILAQRAPRVVRLGEGVRAMPILASVPKALLERVLMRRFGLNKLAP